MQRKCLEDGGRGTSYGKDHIPRKIFIINIGMLNVRTWRTEDRELVLDNALKEHDYSVLGISELRKGEAIIERTK